MKWITIEGGNKMLVPKDKIKGQNAHIKAGTHHSEKFAKKGKS